jgi:cytidylate kinase
MRIQEVISQPLDEGPNDPHIFKAVFMAGGPGSGKSYVARKMLGSSGLKSVNSDEIYEYLAQKQNMDLGDPEVVGSQVGQEVRGKAKELTQKRRDHYLDGRLGLLLDGTGKDVAKVQKDSNALKSLGYETMMVYVNTSEDVAQERNKQRARSIPAEMVSKMWKQVQDNLMQFQQVFGASNFHVVDNSGGQENPERKQNFDQVFKNVQKFLNSPTRSRQAQSWLADQKPGQDQ